MRLSRITESPAGTSTVEVEIETGPEFRLPSLQELDVIRDLLDLPESAIISITQPSLSSIWTEIEAKANLDEMFPEFDFSSLRRKGA